MNISEFDNSEFLGKEDLDKDELIKITGVEQRKMVSRDTGVEQKKCVVHFKKPIKGKTAWVCNQTNRLAIARILRSKETDNWTGGQIVLYVDPTVMMAGKEVGGIRVRAPRKNPHRSVDIEETTSDEDDDEIPY